MVFSFEVYRSFHGLDFTLIDDIAEFTLSLELFWEYLQLLCTVLHKHLRLER